MAEIIHEPKTLFGNIQSLVFPLPKEAEKTTTGAPSFLGRKVEELDTKEQKEGSQISFHMIIYMLMQFMLQSDQEQVLNNKESLLNRVGKETDGKEMLKSKGRTNVATTALGLLATGTQLASAYVRTQPNGSAVASLGRALGFDDLKVSDKAVNAVLSTLGNGSQTISKSFEQFGGGIHDQQNLNIKGKDDVGQNLREAKSMLTQGKETLRKTIETFLQGMMSIFQSMFR